jgi:hypothetical protein
MKRWLRQLERKSVSVHTTDGQSLKGVLVGEYRDCLVLVHAEYLSGDTTQPLDGEAVVLRERVSWIQVLHGEG